MAYTKTELTDVEPNATIANNIYPTCEILENASILLKLCWYSAVTFPIKRVIIEITRSAGIQKSCKGAKHIRNNRRKAAKPAVLTTVLIKAVISVGEPS